MSDTLSRELRSERMSRVHGKDTQPELIVRRVVRSLGYRYRLHDRRLPGSPDLVFARLGKVIFVHGCFWHRHPRCALARLPKSRLDFWLAKLAGNARRDQRNKRALRRLGWEVLVVWECELDEPIKLAFRLLAFLDDGLQK